MGNYSQYKNVNIVFGDTKGIVVPSGNGTTDRPGSPAVGTLRYNTDIGLVEQYNANGWQGIDSSPTVSNISGTIFFDVSSTITINGANFKSGSVVYVEGSGVSGIPRALATTFVSTSQLTAVTASDSVNYVGGQTFNIRVSNPSGLSGLLQPAGTIDREAVWSTASATYTVFDTGRGNNLTFTASDPDGATITYSLVSGSLPSGASLNSSNGQIGPFNAVGSDTTSNFVLGATSTSAAGTAYTTNRSFAITVKAPVVVTFSSVGTTSWTAPTGLTSARVLVVAGGGAGGTRNSGISPGGTDGGAGGGAGGMVDVPSFPISPGSPYSIQVGGGGGNNSNPGPAQGSPGTPSYFGPLTAIGGGGGGAGPGGPVANGLDGGSGGGRGGGGSPNTGVTGSGTQPAQPGLSGSNGYGNRGGYNPNVNPYTGAGGGGANAVGSDGGSGSVGNGGSGRPSTITGSSINYSGGGGGAAFPNGPVGPGSGGSGGGGNGGDAGNGSGRAASYYGGGGGGGAGAPAPGGDGGAGYQGIVIIRY